MFSLVSRWNGFLHAPSLEVDSGTLLMETISLHLKGFKSVLLHFNDLKTLSEQIPCKFEDQNNIVSR